MGNRLYQQLSTGWTYRWQQIFEGGMSPRFMLEMSVFILILLLLSKTMGSDSWVLSSWSSSGVLFWWKVWYLLPSTIIVHSDMTPNTELLPLLGLIMSIVHSTRIIFVYSWFFSLINIVIFVQIVSFFFLVFGSIISKWSINSEWGGIPCSTNYEESLLSCCFHWCFRDCLAANIELHALESTLTEIW